MQTMVTLKLSTIHIITTDNYIIIAIGADRWEVFAYLITHRTLMNLGKYLHRGILCCFVKF